MYFKTWIAKDNGAPSSNFPLSYNIETLMEMNGKEWKLVKMWDVNQLLKIQMLSHIWKYTKPTGVRYETHGMDFYQSAMEQTNKGNIKSIVVRCINWSFLCYCLWWSQNALDNSCKQWTKSSWIKLNLIMIGRVLYFIKSQQVMYLIHLWCAFEPCGTASISCLVRGFTRFQTGNPWCNSIGVECILHVI